MHAGRLKYHTLSQNFWDSCGFGKCTWPEWVDELQGKSGVYVIRSTSGTVYYVGESHTGRLKKTLLRHFQAWTGKTAGNTYSRNAVEIAVQTMAAGLAVKHQDQLIAKLKPRDNTNSTPETKDENPF